MKITLIGSSQYRQIFDDTKRRLELEGNTVRIPAFDDKKNLDDLGVCEYNRELIEWADKIYIIWDQRSSGTIFDFGMAFALRKPVVIEYMGEKTFRGVMEKYSENIRKKANE